MSDRSVPFIPQTDSFVLLDLEPVDKEHLFELMVARLAECGAVLDEKTAIEDVQRREETKPTGLAFGVACPHARTDSVHELAIAVARLKAPLDFGASDGQPARHVFLILSPKADPNPHIDTLAAIVKCYHNKELVGRLDTVTSAAAYRKLLGESS